MKDIVRDFEKVEDKKLEVDNLDLEKLLKKKAVLAITNRLEDVKLVDIKKLDIDSKLDILVEELVVLDNNGISE